MARRSPVRRRRVDDRRDGDHRAGRHVDHARGRANRGRNPELHSFGSCRLCLIEIEGRANLSASCTTPVTPGIAAKTVSPRLDSIRRGIMELYISDHPLDCLTCAANGDCELQTEYKR